MGGGAREMWRDEREMFGGAREMCGEREEEARGTARATTGR
jgi:hypothetical protein